MVQTGRYTGQAYRGEDLASGHRDAETTFKQWQNSTEHRDILLNPYYRVIGIALVYNADSEYGWYWAADFGSLR